MQTPLAPDVAILEILEDVSGIPDLATMPNFDLFEEGALDSLTLIRLLLNLSQHFRIELTPADVRRDEWATPALIVAAVKKHLPA